MAAILMVAQLYQRPVHICHVARKEEVKPNQTRFPSSNITANVPFPPPRSPSSARPS